MSYRTSTDLIRFPNRLASIADIVAHNVSIISEMRGQTPESLAILANLPIQEVRDVFEPQEKAAKLCAVFSIARALKVSPETILGFDQAEINVRRN